MKKSLLLIASIFTAITISSQINSTIVTISPATKVSNDGQTWTFGDGFLMTNTKGKSYGEFAANAYRNDGDTIREATLKISRQVPFKIVIPDGKAVVKIEILGFSNSPEAKNWNFLSYIDNGSEEYMIYKETAVEYNTLNNELIISKCKYPMSPLAKDYRVFASFTDAKGWFSELNYMIDGNNQAGINFRLYVVNEADIDKYKLENDSTITSIRPVVKEEINDSQLYNIFGQRVNANYKGIVIMNGKKYLIK